MIGKTIWESSIFPYKKTWIYMLPLKAEVRKKERIVKGVEIKITRGITESLTK